MSPAHVVEPSYRTLKRRLMEGDWSPGEKLEALRLADELGVSITPVRDCLNRLAGEQLVDAQPGDGYRVPVISEQRLRDMIGLNLFLLEAAIRAGTGDFDLPAAAASYADSIAALFDAIATRSGNMILAESVDSLSARMNTVRMIEPELFGDTASEYDALRKLCTAEDNALLDGLRLYHARRHEEVASLINALATRVSPAARER